MKKKNRKRENQLESQGENGRKKSRPKCGGELYLDEVINDAYWQDNHKKHRSAVADDADGTDDAKCAHNPRV